MNSYVQTYRPVPGGIPDQDIASTFNNAYATGLAEADPRHQMKKMDRGGLSRGRGHAGQAAIGSAQAVQAGIADAYDQQAQLTGYNANSALNGLAGQEMNAQGLGALQQQQSYADQMAALQRQQTGFGILGRLMS
jgi:hypothetical protein